MENCPKDVLLHIFLFLDGKSIQIAKQVCKHWLQVISKNETILWRNRMLLVGNSIFDVQSFQLIGNLTPKSSGYLYFRFKATEFTKVVAQDGLLAVCNIPITSFSYQYMEWQPQTIKVLDLTNRGNVHLTIQLYKHFGGAFQFIEDAPYELFVLHQRYPDKSTYLITKYDLKNGKQLAEMILTNSISQFFLLAQHLVFLVPGSSLLYFISRKDLSIVYQHVIECDSTCRLYKPKKAPVVFYIFHSTLYIYNASGKSVSIHLPSEVYKLQIGNYHALLIFESVILVVDFRTSNIVFDSNFNSQPNCYHFLLESEQGEVKGILIQDSKNQILKYLDLQKAIGWTATSQTWKEKFLFPLFYNEECEESSVVQVIDNRTLWKPDTIIFCFDLLTGNLLWLTELFPLSWNLTPTSFYMRVFEDSKVVLTIVIQPGYYWFIAVDIIKGKIIYQYKKEWDLNLPPKTSSKISHCLLI